MPDLIFVSGSINSGKTTISRLLVDAIPNSAHVHGDSLRHFVTWLPLEAAVPLTLENIAAVGSNFLEAGFNVVIDYPLALAEYEGLRGRLQEEATGVWAFVLAPRLEVAQRRRGERALTSREVRRIGQQYEMGLDAPGYGTVIDNSEQTPEETVELLIEEMASR